MYDEEDCPERVDNPQRPVSVMNAPIEFTSESLLV